MNLKKNWKTTVSGVIAGALVIAGMFWPEKIDPETKQVIEVATEEILQGVGALIAVVAGWKAKDK